MSNGRRLRICIVYDCLYPLTVGGAERWYRALAECLVEAGHEVTYLTRLQWDTAEPPEIGGVRVIAVSRPERLYDDQGQRIVGQAVRFGVGVGRHLLAHRHAYDVVHTCAFPYFSVPAISVSLAGTRTAVGADWFEVWSAEYWRRYLGPVRGTMARGLQWTNARLTPMAFVSSDRYARRFKALGGGSNVRRLPGLYGRSTDVIPTNEPTDPPTVLFVGRLIPEKRAEMVPWVVAELRKTISGVRGMVIGEGPQRGALLAAIEAAGATDAVDVMGFVPAADLDRHMARAACLLNPSQREGYGLVVIESAAHGTPIVVVDGPDNAAADLVHEGVNGYVASSSDPIAVAAAIGRVIAAGRPLRSSTAEWFRRNRESLHVNSSLEAVLSSYERMLASTSPASYGPPADGATGARTSRAGSAVATRAI